MTAPSWLHLFLDVPEAQWDAALAFWPAATGTSLSSTRGEAGQFVTLLPAEGDPWVKLQRLDETGAQPRTHLDLDSTDRAAAVARSIALGAVPAWHYHDVEVCRSPGGLLLCHTVGPRGTLARTSDLVLDQLAIDIPAPLWDTETRFWQDLLGGELLIGSRPELALLQGADVGPRILLQRLDDPTGPVRAHPDLACADRAAATTRHTDLGATVVGEGPRWTVLRAPGGQVYCLTDRDPGTGRLPG
ncbi:MAG TPA: VOC family protein [Dermatophilaceae bacterium]|nr:VOC family protein [Dermatophilaceae bacterium]